MTDNELLTLISEQITLLLRVGLAVCAGVGYLSGVEFFKMIRKLYTEKDF